MAAPKSSSSSNIYAALPFSYLTGNAPDKKKPSLSALSGPGPGEGGGGGGGGPHPGEDQRTAPRATRAPSSAGGPGGRPSRDNRVSLDVTDPMLDVADPYLLSTGALTSGTKVTTNLNDARDSIDSDPRYRDSVPSSSDGDNVFFRPPVAGGTDSGYPSTSGKKGGFSHPDIALMTRDEGGGGGGGGGGGNGKLPRLKVAEDGVYQYYKGKEGDPALQQDNFNPIWDKYYAGGSPADPAAAAAAAAAMGHTSLSDEGYSPRPPLTPGVRLPTREEDYSTLLKRTHERRRRSSEDGGGGGCCPGRSRKVAVVTAVLITAILCLGAGFAIGWFVHQITAAGAVASNINNSTTITSTTPGTQTTPSTAAAAPSPATSPTQSGAASTTTTTITTTTTPTVPTTIPTTPTTPEPVTTPPATPTTSP